MSAHARLSSAHSMLEELVTRVGSAGSELSAGHEDVASDLVEVERALTTAARRLERIVAELDRRGA